jgi:NAD-dependent deacetylase sirtuin 4
MRYQEFMGSPEARARYWVRSMTGWSRFSAARPNAAHRAVTRMEAAGVVVGVITQNVDGLHQEAGTRTVLDLHGSLSRVLCTSCGRVEARDEIQRLLETMNPRARRAPEGSRARPDGDVELPRGAERRFVVPDCRWCGGVLKPDVVFFGENVPRERVARSWEIFETADALLVVGSSLEVFSGRRFVLRAAEEGRPVAIVNLGPTRGDPLADVKVERRLGEFLPRLAGALEGVSV